MKTKEEKTRENSATAREDTERSETTIERLVALWERSVRASHSFLSDAEVQRIKGFIPDALRNFPALLVVENAEGVPTAFAGVDGRRLEALFVDADERGKGFGTLLLRRCVEELGVDETTSNEQNPAATRFYERFGFEVERRTERDEQGASYPLLYLKLRR